MCGLGVGVGVYEKEDMFVIKINVLEFNFDDLIDSLLNRGPSNPKKLFSLILIVNIERKQHCPSKERVIVPPQMRLT